MPFNTALAQYCAHFVKDRVADATTRAVCLTALEAVGRLSWANGMVAFPRLLPGNKLNSHNIGCVCYEAPVAFALMSNAISIHEANDFFRKTEQPDSNAALIQHIYGRFAPAHIEEWSSGDGGIPAGAMVFHGDVNTPCRHVTMSVGNGYIVSCWGVAQAAPAIGGSQGLQSTSYQLLQNQLAELQSKHLSPDTVVLPQVAFSDFKQPAVRLRYTRVPFWTLW